ncbi:MAG: alpha/beta hydrolase [Pseudomonadota bacterium]
MARLFLTLAGLLVLAGCTGLFFHPAEPWVRTPSDVGVDYQDVYFRSEGGPELHGWFLPAASAKGTVVFFHGNAENISTHLASVFWLPRRGFNVFLMDYRGYGSSDGTPTPAGLVADMRAGLAEALTLEGVEPGRVIVWGQSLGAALAPAALSHSEHRSAVAGVILDSPFSSFRAITREKLAGFWLTWPFQYLGAWTVDDTFSPDRHMAALAPLPLLLLHNRGDSIIPPHHSARLHGLAGPGSDLWLLPKGGHIQTTNRPENRDRILDWIRTAIAETD